MSAKSTRAQQRTARQAKVEAARARAERTRRVQVIAVIATVVAIVGAVAALALTGGGGSATTDADGTAYSAAKEAFHLPGLLDEKVPVTLKDHVGTPVVVNFFASWCVYCNEELPGFVQVAKASAGKVDFIGVDTSDPGDGAAMARRFDLAGAGFALGRDIGANPPSQLWTSFGSQGLPVTAFYDAKGALVDFSGGMLTQAELEKRLKTNFGVEVTAPDAAKLGAPVIPLIPQGMQELLRTHEGDPTFVPVDLRPAADFAAGHIAAAISIPATGSALPAATRALEKTASYFLYDADGSASSAIAEAMHTAGFTHVYTLDGGFAAWTAQGLPTGQ